MSKITHLSKIQFEILLYRAMQKAGNLDGGQDVLELEAVKEVVTHFIKLIWRLAGEYATLDTKWTKWKKEDFRAKLKDHYNEVEKNKVIEKYHKKAGIISAGADVYLPANVSKILDEIIFVVCREAYETTFNKWGKYDKLYQLLKENIDCAFAK